MTAFSSLEGAVDGRGRGGASIITLAGGFLIQFSA